MRSAAALDVEESPLIAPDATLRDVAFTVGTALDREGVLAVLCGGSAATFYAPDVYQSEDLDFVLTFGTDGATVRRALGTLGYAFKDTMFVHSASHFTVEFPKGPLAIGAEVVTRFDTVRDGDRTLNIVTAPDVVRDRLNKYAAWDDFSALRAAVGVALEAQVDLDEVGASCGARVAECSGNATKRRCGSSNGGCASAGCELPPAALRSRIRRVDVALA
jgi:hypothetical protein